MSFVRVVSVERQVGGRGGAAALMMGASLLAMGQAQAQVATQPGQPGGGPTGAQSVPTRAAPGSPVGQTAKPPAEAEAINRTPGEAAASPTPVPAESQPSAREENAATNAGMDIIVTGVATSTDARKANVAYSVLTEKDMSKFTPISADDMLRDLPGVFVETNDGVARNEVFTRGMTIGTGSNTSGYFWTTILEDGLPTVPFKFGGFQDGYFYRADISTARVESIRGGTSATSVSTSVGATFNYITGKPKPGLSAQTRIGFEGEDLHLSWKQLDLSYGWMNKDGDFGLGVSGFYRRSNGQVDPGYDLNRGGQIKLNAYKDYTTGNGSGSLNIIFKHLDDVNAELTTFFQPNYGYRQPSEVAGFGRDVNLFINDSKQTVPNYFRPGAHTLDPSYGYRYQQDATWLSWNHDLNSGWHFVGALRFQKSQVRGESYKPQQLNSIASAAATRERFGLNINNLDRTPGFYEFTNAAGVVVGRVANNVAGSQLGTNYRTGAACPRVTATTFQANSLCVVQNLLPNRDLNVRGGVVTATIPTAAGTFPSGIVPVASGSQDLVLLTRAEDTDRSSRDIVANVGANYQQKRFGFNGGVYFARAKQANDNWANGLGVSAWADDQVQNLNVRYVTSTGTVYQLTDSGGWGSYGSGAFPVVTQRATITEISPMGGVNWTPFDFLDFNAAAKYSHFHANTSSYTYDTRNPSAASLASGGLDGNPLTVYDNLYPILTPSKAVKANRSVGVFNWTAAVGVNFNPRHKVYFRYTDGKQPSAGVVQRYSTVQTLVRPLGPTAYVKGYEISYTFAEPRINGAITFFRQNFAVNDYPVGIDTDNVSTYLLPENFNRYFTRGVEAWARMRITDRLEYNPSFTFLNGRTVATYNYLNTGANGLGPADDILRIDSGILARSPKWTLGHVVSYGLGDFRFNVRYRWLSERKLNANTLDRRYLPKQDNVDASVQFLGLKNTTVTFDVRNVFDTQYVSAYDPIISTNLPTNVQIYDVVQQLPDSLFQLKRNAPRSMWLTVRHDF